MMKWKWDLEEKDKKEESRDDEKGSKDGSKVSQEKVKERTLLFASY